MCWGQVAATAGSALLGYKGSKKSAEAANQPTSISRCAGG